MKILNADLKPKKQITSSSPDGFSFTVKGKTFVFDSNSLALTLVDDDEERRKTLGSCVRWKPVFPHFSVSKLGNMVIEACHCCNLKCRYCLVAQYYPGIDMMKLETAKAAIAYFFPKEQLHEKASIGFFGGEPMLNWKLMTELTHYFEGLCAPRKPGLHVTTNGTLLTPEKVDFLVRHGYSMIVSIDGPRDVHDANRVDSHGEGSFDTVMQGLENCKAAGMKRITLRATYTPETAEHIVESVKFLNQLVYDGYANWVSVEPAFLTESMCVDPSAARHGITDEDIQKLDESYLRVADWYIEEVRAGRKPVFHNITKTIERILWTTPYFTECGAGMGYAAINSKGDLFPCHRESSGKIGNVFIGGVDEELRAQWRDNRGYLRIGCIHCPIRFVCGSGCREESLNECKDIRMPFKVACRLKDIFFRASVYVMAELGPDVLKGIVSQPRASLPKVGQDNSRGVQSSKEQTIVGDVNEEVQL